MQLEVGNILEGKITGITKFGAFVELADGNTGMVHISEVSKTYVKDINDHLKENQLVKVKVLSIGDQGKVSLSIKGCMEAAPQQMQTENISQQNRVQKNKYVKKDMGWRGPKQTRNNDELSFEDMLARFKQTSDDKMSDIKRNTDSKRGSRRSGHR